MSDVMGSPFEPSTAAVSIAHATVPQARHTRPHPSGTYEGSEVSSRLPLSHARERGPGGEEFSIDVLASARSTSATLQAWETQPRGVYGGSASKISLIVPSADSPRCRSKPARARRAPT